MIVLLAVAFAGGRYYFMVYRKSAGFALSGFLGAVNKGKVSDQYAYIDDADKSSDYPTEADWDKSVLAHGFVDRVPSVSLASPEIDAKDPHVAKISVSVSIRKVGQELYQAASDTDTDHYVMRQDKNGDWKVVISESDIVSFQKATPSKIGF